jgi:hypothetical protein
MMRVGDTPYIVFLVGTGGPITVDRPTTVLNGTYAEQFALRSSEPVTVETIDALGNKLEPIVAQEGWTVIPTAPGGVHLVRPC